MFDNTGDKSVTMCGVAQEDISNDQEGEDKSVYTKPWHVTVTMTGVRALHSALRSPNPFHVLKVDFSRSLCHVSDPL